MTVAQMHQRLDEIIWKTPAGEPLVLEVAGETLSIDTRPPQGIRLGIMYDPNFRLPDSFWEPLNDEECGLVEHPNDPLFEKENA